MSESVFADWTAIREQFERITDSWIEERAAVLDIRPAGDHVLAAQQTAAEASEG